MPFKKKAGHYASLQAYQYRQEFQDGGGPANRTRIATANPPRQYDKRRAVTNAAASLSRSGVTDESARRQIPTWEGARGEPLDRVTPQHVCVEAPASVAGSMRAHITTGKPRKFDDVEHAGRTIDKKESARLQQANVLPAAPCVAPLAEYLSTLLGVKVLMQVTKILTGGIELQLAHADSMRAEDGEQEDAAQVICKRRSDGCTPAYVAWMPIDGGSATLMLQSGLWRKGHDGKYKPPPMELVSAKAGQLLLMSVDCLHAGTQNLPTSVRWHSYVFEADRPWPLLAPSKEPSVHLATE